MRRFRQSLYILVALSLILGGCMGAVRYSDDSEIATVQQWAQACKQTGQAIQTATMLYQSGHLSEIEAAVVDRIDRVYLPICTGEPAALDEVLKDAAIKAAVADLCPELGLGFSEDVVVTVAQATACAARKALLLQLEES